MGIMGTPVLREGGYIDMLGGCSFGLLHRGGIDSSGCFIFFLA